MKRVLLLTVVLVATGGALYAGDGPGGSNTTGDVRVDLFGLREMRDGPALAMSDSSLPLPSKKSPWLAAGLSLLLPGTGEIYAGSYWKAALFFALDVTAWVLAYKFDRRARDQTDFFEGYANQHWSVVRYAEYAQTLAQQDRTYSWRIPGTEGLDPWKQVNWAELNRMERDIAGYYSHTLPEYGSQQYFELIGKYPQFNQGWDDAPASFNYGDPLTARFLYYADERGKANDYYANASTWVKVAIVNHILSAIDAAWSAGTYNSSVHAQVGMRQIPLLNRVAGVPELKVVVNF